jgi:hypothetical protein
MPFKVASRNSEYVAEVRVSDKKGEIHPWLWSYELTVTRAGNATPIWSAAYDFNGYSGGVLSNDGEYFAFVEYWYCDDCAAATFYHRGVTRHFTGHELGMVPESLQRTVSHRLWLKSYYFEEANGMPKALVIETVQGNKRIELTPQN